MHRMKTFKAVSGASLCAFVMGAASVHAAPELIIASSADSDWPQEDEKPRAPEESQPATDKSPANTDDARGEQKGNAVDPDFPDESDETRESYRRPASSGTSNQGPSSVDPDWPSQ